MVMVKEGGKRIPEVCESMDEFLKRCQISGDSAYGAFRSLLESLENPVTRTEARVFFTHLRRRFSSDQDLQSCLSTYHFQIQDIAVEQYKVSSISNCNGYERRKKLTMMVIPSIFIPEDWSFTFYEGLCRNLDSIFKDKTVAEIGCGNGWITIAIAEKWSPLKVYGLDINPRAIKISWINLYLNALDDDGQLIYDDERKTLLDRVTFHESDLLAYCRNHDIKLDRIVGCIPQILNPNPDAMSKIITENASEEFLHSLSNYCGLQGFVEDQFGLGLVAKAAEEGIDIIQPMGIMIFNIGGRPGQAVCKRLFERRGLRVTKLWQTKILQAADTDISALVEIENNSPHRFEFFMGIVGDRPICARTAWTYERAGGQISHALSVYSCQLRQPSQVKKIFEFLKNGFHEISSSLDLSFDDDSVADEKIPFLAHFASILKEQSVFPYEPPAGQRQFRNLVSGFMKTYHHVPLRSSDVVVFPSRAAAIESALRLFSPRLAIIDERLTRYLPKQWLTSLAQNKSEVSSSVDDMFTVIEAPCQSDLLIELIKKLKPQMVVTGMTHYESVTSSTFEHLLNTTKEVSARLFLDISDHFDLSSFPASNGVFKHLAGNVLPSHAAIICSLLKNKVYSDLEVAFVISEDQGIVKAMSKTIEVLEGNTSLISQYYYGCLFYELLDFQLVDRHPTTKRGKDSSKSVDMIGFSPSADSVINDAELSVIDEDESSLIIHMDVDQSFLPTPSPVKAAIFESFARQNITEPETDVSTLITRFIKLNYGFPAYNLVYADSPLSLFNKLVLCCVQERGTMCFPASSNRNLISAARFLKADVVIIPTDVEAGFKLTEDKLEKFFRTFEGNPWLYICGPIINPTGLIYSNKEIKSILSVCAKAGARVVIDTSFSGFGFDSNRDDCWDLEECVNYGSSPFCISLIGGLSQKILTGGLTFGFLSLHDSIVTEFYNFPVLNKPHGTVKYAMRKLLGLMEKKSGALWDALADHRGIISTRMCRLKQTLESSGWNVVEPEGGISLVAKPGDAYAGRSVKVVKSVIDGGFSEPYMMKIDEHDIRDAILLTTGLCINGSRWTGLPGYCRFTFGIEDHKFEEALTCIIKFKDLVMPI